MASAANNVAGLRPKAQPYCVHLSTLCRCAPIMTAAACRIAHTARGRKRVIASLPCVFIGIIAASFRITAKAWHIAAGRSSGERSAPARDAENILASSAMKAEITPDYSVKPLIKCKTKSRARSPCAAPSHSPACASRPEAAR